MRFTITTPYIPTTEVVTALGTYRGTIQPALQLLDARTGQPVATPTVNLVDDPPSPGCTWIKDYAEGTGMTLALSHAGVIRVTGRSTTFGYGCRAFEAQVLVTTEEQA